MTRYSGATVLDSHEVPSVGNVSTFKERFESMLVEQNWQADLENVGSPSRAKNFADMATA